MDDNKLEAKLLKIKALAERGEGGEKESAIKLYNKLLKIEALIGYPLNKIQDHSIFILSYMVVKYYCEYQNNVLI